MPIGNWYSAWQKIERKWLRANCGQRRRKRAAAELLEPRELLTVTVGAATPGSNNTISVPIVFDTAQDGFLAADIDFAYDTAKLNLTSAGVVAGTATANWVVTPTVNEASGTVVVSMFGLTSIDPGQLQILVLNFQPASGATGSASIEITSAVFSAVNEGDIATGNLVDGTVTMERGSLSTSLVRVPSPAQQLDQVETVPDSETWIDEWTPHWLEVWARTDANNLGINRVSVDVSFDADLFVPQIFEAGDAFASGLTHMEDAVAGRIELTANRTTSARVGDGQHVLVARIFFQPTLTGPGLALDAQSNTPIAPLGQPWERLLSTPRLFVGSQTASLAVNTSLGAAPATDLWPVMYDLDDDGRIGFGDLALFTAAFLKTAGDGPGTVKPDFDLSGSVGFGDLSFFSANFLQTRTSTTPLMYPANFPAAFGGSSLRLAGAGAAPASAAPPAFESYASALLPLQAVDVLMLALSEADDDADGEPDGL